MPTRLVYGRDHKVAKWGFLCEDEDGEEVDDVFEFFKIYLDQDSIDEAHRNGVRDIPATIEDTKRLITDYLEQVYAQIKRSVEANVGPWKDMKVEFVFSIPTTWRALSITTDFERAVRAAGFGGEFNHTAKLELTEAEAAAVYVAGNPQVRFTSGDILLVCDAGGGTTDLGLIQVVDQNPNIPALNQVAAVQGVGIGSTMIDRAFESLIQRRLNNNPDVQRLLPPNLARKMARSPTFRAIKHNFGSGLDQQEYKFALYKFAQDRPGVPSDYKHPGCRIDKGRLIVSRYTSTPYV